MRHARKALVVALCLLAGVLLGLAAPDPAPAVQRPARNLDVQIEPEPQGMARLAAAGPTLGFRWAQTVAVYDGTGEPAWKVTQAAAEWSNRTGATVVMTADPSKANIVVTEVGIPGNLPGALGVAYYPPNTAGVAYGTCQVQLADWLPEPYPLTAEHTAIHELGHCLGMAHNTADKRAVMEPSVRLGTGFTRPQAADLKTIRALYQ